MEIEAKFSFRDAAAFETWLGRYRLGPFSLLHPRTIEVSDDYLDSANYACLRAGYACRLRRHAGGWTATLKSLADVAPGDASGVRRRDELEVELTTPDSADASADAHGQDVAAWQQPGAWPESPARDLALRLLQGASLRHLATLRQERHERDVRDGVR
ncbi:MAG TPA: CYTH domain-containing protein, partial [Dehalococcoidia bacterium]